MAAFDGPARTRGLGTRDRGCARAWAVSFVEALRETRRLAASLVHGDFFAGNVLVSADRVVAVVDWEEAQFDWVSAVEPPRRSDATESMIAPTTSRQEALEPRPVSRKRGQG
jgi:Phosphotransferase enzyme family